LIVTGAKHVTTRSTSPREARHHAKHVTKGMLNAAAKSVASVATKMRDSAVQVILATMRLPHYE